MSKSLSPPDYAAEFFSHIEQFRLACTCYQNSADDSQPTLLETTIENLSMALSRKPKLFKILAEDDWCQNLQDLFETLLNRNDCELFMKVCSYITNFTDKSELVCESLIKVGMSEVLVDSYLKFCDRKAPPKDTKHILVEIITIVHNIARHVKFQQYFLQHPKIDQFKTLILPLCADRNDDVSIVANLVMIWLAKEDDQGMKIMAKNSDIIKKIFSYIQRTFFAEENPITTWSLWELLEGLQALSTIYSNKTEMIALDEFVLTLIKIITSGKYSDKEIELSLGILWHLSFLEDNQIILTNEYNIRSVVEPLVRSVNLGIRDNARGILWNLKSDHVRILASKNIKYDIFLSYSHAQKELVTKIVKKLKKDFTVWIDIDNIKGSSLEDMTSGIERSRIFVMCVSNAYKQSQYCQSEANYAYQNKKPMVPLIMEHKYKPDGWLGIITSTEFYIDVSDIGQFTDNMTKIVSAINYKCEPLSGECSEDKAKVGRLRNIKDWSKDQVSCWVVDSGLSHIEYKFKVFDGGMIDALMNMKQECSIAYYYFLGDKWGLSFEEILKLNAALLNLVS